MVIRTYVLDALESVTDCYIERSLHDGLVKLSAKLIETYKSYLKAKHGRLILSWNKNEGCDEVSFYVYVF